MHVLCCIRRHTKLKSEYNGMGMEHSLLIELATDRDRAMKITRRKPFVENIERAEPLSLYSTRRLLSLCWKLSHYKMKYTLKTNNSTYIPYGCFIIKRKLNEYAK